MNIAMQIENELTDYTIKNSRFEEKRNYISMSGAVYNVEKIVDNFIKGYQAGRKERLKCYKGYQMEADLLRRIKAVFGDRLDGRVTFKQEIAAFDGLVKGHPDLVFHGIPVDVKSVLMDEWIPGIKTVMRPMLPRKVYWQMQAYMLYGKSKNGIVLYESRENGLLRCFEVSENVRVQGEIDAKFRDAVKTVNGGASSIGAAPGS